MTAICPAGPPKLNAATRSQVRNASSSDTPCCGFHRSVIDSSAKACLVAGVNAPGALERRVLSAFLPEVLVEVVEHLGPACEALRVVARRGADAFH